VNLTYVFFYYPSSTGGYPPYS